MICLHLLQHPNPLKKIRHSLVPVSSCEWAFGGISLPSSWCSGVSPYRVPSRILYLWLQPSFSVLSTENSVVAWTPAPQDSDLPLLKMYLGIVLKCESIRQLSSSHSTWALGPGLENCALAIGGYPALVYLNGDLGRGRWQRRRKETADGRRHKLLNLEMDQSRREAKAWKEESWEFFCFFPPLVMSYGSFTY